MKNLSNITLTAAIDYVPPYCDFQNINNSDTDFKDLSYSIEFELLKFMMDRYGFQVVLKNSLYDLGEKLNQTWTGNFGKKLNGTLDFVMCCKDLSKQNFEEFELTRSILFDEFTFLSLVPEQRPRTWIILEPFYIQLWLSILVVWFICIIFLASSNIFDLYAILIRQSIELRKLRFKNGTIFVGWLLACLVLSSSYIGVFHSILTFPYYEDAIETKEDLGKYLQLDDSFTRILMYRQYFPEIFESNEGEDFIYSLIRSFDRKTKYPYESSVNKLINNFQERVSKQVIFIDFRLFLMWFRRKTWDLDKHLYLSSDRLKTIPIGWILPRGSPLLVPFNRVIVGAFEMGIVQYWTDKTFKIFPAKDQSLAYDRNFFEKGSFRAFKLDDFRSIFIVWCLGIIVSLICYVLEILIFFLKSSKLISLIP